MLHMVNQHVLMHLIFKKLISASHHFILPKHNGRITLSVSVLKSDKTNNPKLPEVPHKTGENGFHLNWI